MAAAMALMAEKNPMKTGACARPPSMLVKGLASYFFHTPDRRCWYSVAASLFPLCRMND